MGKVNIAKDLDKATLKAAYQQALTDLQTTQTTDLNNNAKLQQAVKGMAEILEKLLKGIKRIL